ncbi:MAG: hypothetical protein Q7S22_08615 [Candidatus Micrarchaeota archaeon]|nr:hypothetical protein [Candidatus Micrarchaeota archaeon]
MRKLAKSNVAVTSSENQPSTFRRKVFGRWFGRSNSIEESGEKPEKAKKVERFEKLLTQLTTPEAKEALTLVRENTDYYKIINYLLSLSEDNIQTRLQKFRTYLKIVFPYIIFGEVVVVLALLSPAIKSSGATLAGLSIGLVGSYADLASTKRALDTVDYIVKQTPLLSSFQSLPSEFSNLLSAVKMESGEANILARKYVKSLPNKSYISLLNPAALQVAVVATVATTVALAIVATLAYLQIPLPFPPSSYVSFMVASIVLALGTSRLAVTFHNLRAVKITGEEAVEKLDDELQGINAHLARLARDKERGQVDEISTS